MPTTLRGAQSTHHLPFHATADRLPSAPVAAARLVLPLRGGQHLSSGAAFGALCRPAHSGGNTRPFLPTEVSAMSEPLDFHGPWRDELRAQQLAKMQIAETREEAQAAYALIHRIDTWRTTPAKVD